MSVMSDAVLRYLSLIAEIRELIPELGELGRYTMTSENVDQYEVRILRGLLKRQRDPEIKRLIEQYADGDADEHQG